MVGSSPRQSACCGIYTYMYEAKAPSESRFFPTPTNPPPLRVYIYILLFSRSVREKINANKRRIRGDKKILLFSHIVFIFLLNNQKIYRYEKR